MPIDDTWAFVLIGEPFPSNPVRVMGKDNMYVALWYKHGKPICGRAWNNGGVVECSFPYAGKEFTGAKDLGGREIQILTYSGDFASNGYYYEWLPFPERLQPHLRMVRCGNSAPVLLRGRSGKRLLGNIKLDTETISISKDHKEEVYSGDKVKESWVISRNYRAPEKLNFGEVTWIDVNEKDPFPEDKILAAPPSLLLESGQRIPQHVALWFKEGEAVLGRCWNNQGFLAATFGWNGKEYFQDIGSFQALHYTNASEMGYELRWVPQEDLSNPDWHPVRVRNVVPCIIRTVEGLEVLGQIYLNQEKVSYGYGTKEEVLAGPKVHKFLVLCRNWGENLVSEEDSQSQVSSEEKQETEGRQDIKEEEEDGGEPIQEEQGDMTQNQEATQEQEDEGSLTGEQQEDATQYQEELAEEEQGDATQTREQEEGTHPIQKEQGDPTQEEQGDPTQEEQRPGESIQEQEEEGDPTLEHGQMQDADELEPTQHSLEDATQMEDYESQEFAVPEEIDSTQAESVHPTTSSIEDSTQRDTEESRESGMRSTEDDGFSTIHSEDSHNSMDSLSTYKVQSLHSEEDIPQEDTKSFLETDHTQVHPFPEDIASLPSLVDSPAMDDFPQETEPQENGQIQPDATETGTEAEKPTQPEEEGETKTEDTRLTLPFVESSGEGAAVELTLRNLTHGPLSYKLKANDPRKFKIRKVEGGREVLEKDTSFKLNLVWMEPRETDKLMLETEVEEEKRRRRTRLTPILVSQTESLSPRKMEISIRETPDKDQKWTVSVSEESTTGIQTVIHADITPLALLISAIIILILAIIFSKF